MSLKQKKEPAKKIKINCDVKDSIPLSKLEPFQGDLKSLANEDFLRLKKEILETGFAFPIYVWKSGKRSFIIGGHQRVRVLTKMKEEGYEIDQIPVVYIKADTIEIAKRRILQDISQYGKIEKEGLQKFITENNFNFDEILTSFRLPEIDMIDFTKVMTATEEKQTAESEWTGMPEFSQESKESFRHIIVHFNSNEDAEKFFKKIGQEYTEKTKSIWFPQQENMDSESKRY